MSMKNTTFAGLTGAVIGAGLAATAFALSDKNKLKMLEKKVNDTTIQAKKMLFSVKNNAENAVEKTKASKEIVDEHTKEASNELKKLQSN